MYYDFRSPVVYAPGYYTTERTYLIESNLYDVKTGDLIWTVQSSSFNPSSFESWFNGYAQLMLTQMNKDGLIQQGPPIIKDDIYDMHTSQNALDWSGTYSGILPCASCEGIEVQVTLNKDRAFRRKYSNLGKQEEPLVERGKFAWRDGNTILLQGLNSSEVPIYYKIEENQIRQLDTSGKLIKGELAGQYVLIKHGNLSIEDKKWQLIELNGRKVKGNDSSHYVIFHSKEGLLEARAGCNNLSYPYVIKNAFQFSAGQGASTMMACQNDLDETELMEAIERADNINFDEMTLSLNKAKMAPLARFELVR